MIVGLVDYIWDKSDCVFVFLGYGLDIFIGLVLYDMFCVIFGVYYVIVNNGVENVEIESFRW